MAPVCLLLRASTCIALLGVTSCAADPYDFGMAADAGADASGRPAPGPTSSTPTPTAPVVIEPPTMATGCGAGEYYVGRVQGQLLDFAGVPVRGANVTVCGSVCVPGVSGADGRFEVRIERCFTGTTEYAHGAALGFDGQGQRTDLYLDFNPTNEARMGVVRIQRPLYLGAYAGAGAAPAPSTSSAAMNLVDGLGFSLTLRPDTIEYPISAPDEVVRAVRVPLAKVPPYAGRAPSVVYAISPADATLRSPAAVEFPNVSGLRPGAVVDIVAVGNHGTLGRPPVGVLDRIGSGHVSVDGRRVIADSGLRAFGTVGYRTVTP